MRQRRGVSGLCGVLALDKPYGMTSHDVVNRVRQITGERRVGHAGTRQDMVVSLRPMRSVPPLREVQERAQDCNVRRQGTGRAVR